MINRKPQIIAVYMSFLVALILEVLPMPGWIAAFRPEWIALTLLYWTLALPGNVNIGHAWTLGIIMDLLSGSLLGQHALGLVLISLTTVHLHQQIRNFPLWEQSLVMTLIIAVYMGLMLWIEGVRGRSPDSWLYWAPAISHLMLWPWLFLALRGIRRRYVTGHKAL